VKSKDRFLKDAKAYLQQVEYGDISEFSFLLERGMDLTGDTVATISKTFDVSHSGVNSWLNGSSAPHPKMHKHIIQFFCNKLTEAAPVEEEQEDDIVDEVLEIGGVIAGIVSLIGSDDSGSDDSSSGDDDFGFGGGNSGGGGSSEDW